MQRPCRTYGFPVLFDVRFIQELIKDTLEALASAHIDEASLVNLKDSYAADKAELEKLLTVSEEILAGAERCIQKLKQVRATQPELATKAEEAETKLRSSGELGHFLEDKVFAQSKQLLEKMLFQVGIGNVLLY